MINAAAAQRWSDRVATLLALLQAQRKAIYGQAAVIIPFLQLSSIMPVRHQYYRPI